MDPERRGQSFTRLRQTKTEIKRQMTGRTNRLGRQNHRQRKPRTKKAPKNGKARQTEESLLDEERKSRPLTISDAFARNNYELWPQEPTSKEPNTLQGNDVTWWTLQNSSRYSLVLFETKGILTIEKYKARLEARGHTRQEGTDLTEAFVPYKLVRTLLATAATEEGIIHQVDARGRINKRITYETPRSAWREYRK